MTIIEAKKIIELCADAVTKTTGEETKVYVSKDYILQILDMVDENPRPDWPDYPYPWNPCNPLVTYKDQGEWVWRKVSTGTGENDPGEWHLVYEKGPDPYTPYCDDFNTTGHQPMTPNIHVSCDDTVKYKYSSSDSSMYKDTETITTTMNSKETPVDVSPKRTDFIDDFVSNETVSK